MNPSSASRSAGANVANLFLVRTEGRRREVGGWDFRSRLLGPFGWNHTPDT